MMSLGQEIVWECLPGPPDSKNLQKPCFFHEKSSKIIDFSWFSLSELTQRSRHAYRGGRWRPACFLNLLTLLTDHNACTALGPNRRM